MVRVWNLCQNSLNPLALWRFSSTGWELLVHFEAGKQVVWISFATNQTGFRVHAWNFERRCQGGLLEDSACVTSVLRCRLPFPMNSNRLKLSGQSTVFSVRARNYSSFAGMIHFLWLPLPVLVTSTLLKVAWRLNSWKWQTKAASAAIRARCVLCLKALNFVVVSTKVADIQTHFPGSSCCEFLHMNNCRQVTKAVA